MSGLPVLDRVIVFKWFKSICWRKSLKGVYHSSIYLSARNLTPINFPFFNSLSVIISAQSKHSTVSPACFWGWIRGTVQTRRSLIYVRGFYLVNLQPWCITNVHHSLKIIQLLLALDFIYCWVSSMIQSELLQKKMALAIKSLHMIASRSPPNHQAKCIQVLQTLTFKHTWSLFFTCWVNIQIDQQLQNMQNLQFHNSFTLSDSVGFTAAVS